MNLHLKKTHFIIGACLLLSSQNLLAQKKPLQATGAGSDALLITPAGNVGIGTPDPLTRLHVAGSGEVELSLQSLAARGRRFTLQSGPTGVDYKTQFQIIDRTAAVCRLGIDSNGNIGINNRNPEKALDVTGEIKSSGTITAPTFKGTLQGDVNATTVTAQTFKGNVEGTTMTAQTFKGNIEATTITATNTVSAKALRADGGTMLFTGGTKEGSTNVVLHRNEHDAYIYPFGTGTKSNMLVVGGGLAQNNTGFIVTGPTQLRNGVVVAQESLFEGFVEIRGNRNVRPPRFRHFSGQTYNGDGFLGSDPTDSWPISLKAQNVVMGSDFFAFSDVRIKKDLKQSDAAKDLDILKRLQVTDYKYIDFMNHGTQAKKGFIAQQVESVFAEAVHSGSDFIPNIFAAPEKITAAGNKVTITMSKPHQLADGDEIRIYTKAGEQQKIITWLSANSFSVDGSLQDFEEAFVFGKKVNDFRTVDYDRLFTLNVSATQELARKVETLEREYEKMKQAYDDLSQKMSRVEALLSGAGNSNTATASK